MEYKWGEPRRVAEDLWWMTISIYDEMFPENLVREATVTWSPDGTGYYGVFISYEREGVGLHCWPQFRALSDAQDFAEKLMDMDLSDAETIHGKQWREVI